MNSAQFQCFLFLTSFLLSITSHADILVNGSFELPVIPRNSLTKNIVPIGWTDTGTNIFMGNGNVPDGNGAVGIYPSPTNGNQYFDIGNDSLSLSQTFTVTSAGIYTLTWYDNTANESNSLVSAYSVHISGQNLGGFDAHHVGGHWLIHSKDMHLNSGSNTLTFTEAPYAGGLDTMLDDVSLVSNNKLQPVLIWNNPDEITYGTLLNGSQLNAKAYVPGTFAELLGTYTYDPPFGSKLHVVYELPQTLTVLFTPTDTTNYSTATTNVEIVVHRKDLTVTAEVDSQVYNGTTIAKNVTLIPHQIPGDNVHPSYNTALFDDKNVGTGKHVAVEGIYLEPIDDYDNYNLVNTTDDTTAAITTAPLNIYITVPDKEYDGTTDATLMLTDNKYSGDDIDDIYSTATFPDKNVGHNKTVTFNGLTFSGPDSINYTHFNINGQVTGNITNRLITVKAVTDSKIYDGMAGSVRLPNITSGSLISGDSAAWTQAFNNKNVGTGKTLTPAGSVADGNGGNNYAVTFVNDFTGSITPRQITVTAVTDSKVYNGTTSSVGLPTITSGSLAIADSALWTQTFNDKNVGTNKTLAPIGSVADGNGGNNYAVTFVNDNTGSIALRPLTVMTTGINKVYDGTTAATVSLTDNKISGESVVDNYVSAMFADPTVGNSKPVSVTGITINGLDVGNYVLVNTNAGTTANITGVPIDQDGRFEFPVEADVAYFATGQSIDGVWFVESTTIHPNLYNNAGPTVTGGGLFYPTPDGSQFVYLCDSVGVTVLRQDLATPLLASNNYSLSFLQSGFVFSYPALVTVYITPTGSTNVTFTQTFSVPSAANWTLQQTNFDVPADGLYSLRLKSTQGNVANIDDVSITVAGISTNPPAITTQPNSLTGVAGNNVNLTVNAGGSYPLAFQWFFNGSKLSDNPHIGGSTANALMITNLTTADAGGYQVVITNAFGSITSAVATLTITNYFDLVQDGSFELPVETDFAYFETGQSIDGVWFVEGTTVHPDLYNNASSTVAGGGLFHPTPDGSQFVYLCDSVGVTVLRQDLATPLLGGKNYSLSFLQSGFVVSFPALVTVYITPAGSTNVVYTQTFSVPPAADWTLQQTNLTVPADGLYSLRLKSTQGNVANVDDVSIVAAPVAAPPVFQNISRQGNAIVLVLSVIVGQSYQLQYKTNLNQPNWLNLGAPLTATNTTVSTTETLGPDPQRFYRVLVGQ